MSQPRKAALKDYTDFLDTYDTAIKKFTKKELGLTDLAFQLRASKLGLCRDRLSDEEVEVIRYLYPQIGDAVMFLFPERTLTEIRRCVLEEDDTDDTLCSVTISMQCFD